MHHVQCSHIEYNHGYNHAHTGRCMAPHEGPHEKPQLGDYTIPNWASASAPSVEVVVGEFAPTLPTIEPRLPTIVGSLEGYGSSLAEVVVGAFAMFVGSVDAVVGGRALHPGGIVGNES